MRISGSSLWKRSFRTGCTWITCQYCGCRERDQSVETCARGRNWWKAKEIIWAEKAAGRPQRETGKCTAQKRNWWGNATGKEHPDRMAGIGICASALLVNIAVHYVTSYPSRLFLFAGSLFAGMILCGLYVGIRYAVEQAKKRHICQHKRAI